MLNDRPPSLLPLSVDGHLRPQSRCKYRPLAVLVEVPIDEDGEEAVLASQNMGSPAAFFHTYPL